MTILQTPPQRQSYMHVQDGPTPIIAEQQESGAWQGQQRQHQAELTIHMTAPSNFAKYHLDIFHYTLDNGTGLDCPQRIEQHAVNAQCSLFPCKPHVAACFSEFVIIGSLENVCDVDFCIWFLAICKLV